MANIAELTVQIGADISNYQNNMNTVQDTMQNVGQNMQRVGQTIGVAFSAAGLAVGAGLAVAVNKSMEFESQMSRVGAISGASGKELDALKKSALELGASTSKSASEVAIGQEALAALGFTANDIIGAMPGVISAAEASGADMAQTAEVMASALNIFGLKAGDANKVADVLAKTANQSAADINDMGYALKYAGPVAASLGVPIEELSGAIGLMADAGLDGSSAGTAMRAGLLALLSPSEKNSKAMDAMGLSMTDANGKFVGISGVISQLNGSMEGMTDAQKTATLASLVGTEASSGFLALMSAGPAEIDKMTSSLQNSGGASAEAAGKMKDNLKGAVDELSGAFETMQITIGTALTPALTVIASVVQKVADGFNGLSPSAQSFIAIGAAVTAILLVLVGVAGFLTAALGSLAVAEWAAIAPVAGIVAAIAGAIIAIIALGAAVIMAYNKIDWFKAGVDTAWAAIKSAFNVALTFIKSIVDKIMTQVTSFFGKKLGEIEKFWSKNGAQIKQALQVAMTAIQGIVQTVMAVVQAVISVAWTTIQSVTSAVWKGIKGVIDGALKMIMGIIKTFASLLTGDWAGAWEGVKEITRGALKILGSIVKGTLEIGKNLIKGLIDGVAGAAKDLYKKVGEIAGNVTKKFKDIFDIHSPSKVTHTIGSQVGQGLANGIQSKKKAAEDAAKQVADAVAAKFNASKNSIEKQKYFNEASLTEELAAWQKVVSEHKKGSEERMQADREVYRVKNEINKKLISINDEYASKVKAANQKLLEDETRLTAEYTKAVADRTAALTSFAGIFDKVKEASSTSGQELIDNLRGQVSTFAEWSSNIQSLATKGIDGGLLEELRQMGPKAYGEIAALNTLTDEQLTEYSLLWKEKNRMARVEATKELEGLKAETALKISELRKQTAASLMIYKNEWINKIKEIKTGTLNEFVTLNTSMQKIGNDSIKGLMAGLNEMTGPLMKQAKEIANAVSGTIKDALKIKSPSRVMMGLGEFAGEGLAAGMANTLSTIADTANQMALATMPSVGRSVLTQSTASQQASTQFGDIHITIPARDIQEFQSVTDFFKKMPQIARQHGEKLPNYMQVKI